MRRIASAILVIVAMVGCGRSSSSSDSGELAGAVQTYCSGLSFTFESLRGLAERGEYDELGLLWSGDARSPFSNVDAHFRFCNESLVRVVARDDDAWIGIDREYGGQVSVPDSLHRLRAGNGTATDREELLERLSLARELVEQLLTHVPR